MNSLPIRVFDFLENQGDPFSNIKGVEICLSSHETIFACSDLPGFEEQELYTLEYLYCHNLIGNFIDQFSIRGVEDLNLIDPKELERLFHLGKVQLWCHIYPSEEYLIFTKKNGYMLVSDDEMEHKLGTPLVTHEDFHVYTRHYFSA